MVRRIIACAFLALVLTIPLSVACASSSVGQVVNKLEQAYESLKDMQADFQQHTRSGSVGVVQQAEGTVYFKKTGKMLWKYEKPEEQHILLDGKTLWVYLPAEKQAMKNNFSSIPQHIVVDLFRGRMDIQQKFTVSFVQRVTSEASEQLMIELVPIVYDPMLAKLILWIEPSSYLVQKTALTDAFGNCTELTFVDIRVDQGLSDKLFKFTPPRGVDVFEPPQL